MRIGVIGLGKLGLPLAVLFSSQYEVKGMDVNEERIKEIKNRESFFEPQLNEYLEKMGDNLEVSSSYSLLKSCDVVFIITQTPSLSSGKFDLKYVESALDRLHQVNPECLAVTSSTINIGDTAKLKTIHPRVAYNPEFIKQGSIIRDFENPNFILIGAYTEKDGKEAAGIWAKLHDKPIYVVTPTEAEIIKLSLNVSFTFGITFANMIGDLCEKFEADSDKVLDVIYQDRREYKAGLGFGGPCFPRDVNCFKEICSENKVESGHKFATLLDKLNSHRVEQHIDKIRSLNKKKIGILGIAYKPDVPYIYESQPLRIAQKLLDEGYDIFIYDPLAEENAKQVLDKEAIFCNSVNECIKEAEITLIGTPNYSNTKTTKPIINPWK